MHKILPILLLYLLFCTPTFADIEQPSNTHHNPTPTIMGLEDATQAIRFARETISDTNTTLSLVQINQLRSNLTSVANYMDLLEEQRNSKRHYNWTTLGKERIQAKRINSDHFPRKVRTPINKTAAVRFRATRGDIYLIDMRVLDSQGNSHPYELNRWAYASLPQKPTILLDQSLDVTQIHVRSRHNGERSYRLFTSVGVPETPEYAYQIAALCRKLQARITDERPHQYLNDLNQIHNKLQQYQHTQSNPAKSNN